MPYNFCLDEDSELARDVKVLSVQAMEIRKGFLCKEKKKKLVGKYLQSLYQEGIVTSRSLK